MSIIENLNQETNMIRESLSILPKNTPKNMEKCREYITAQQASFLPRKEACYQEIMRRFELLKNIPERPEIKEVEQQIESLNKTYLFDTFKNPYEKMGLDVILYRLNYFYNSDLDKVNENILECIRKFHEVGIDKLDFNFSPYAKEYMTILLEEGNSSEKVHQAFETIFWKCSDLITHIILNIKSIYYKNEKKIEKYYDDLEKGYLTEVGLTKKEYTKKYLDLKQKRQYYYEHDIHHLLERFQSGELKSKDYHDDSLTKAKEYFKTKEDINEESFYSNIKNLEYSLLIYQLYKKYSYLVDGIKKRYQEKEKNKTDYATKLKEIQT